MNNRIKQNRAQRPSQRPKFRENERPTIYDIRDQVSLQFPNTNPLQLALFKTRLYENRRRRKVKDAVLLIVALGIATLLLITALNFI